MLEPCCILYFYYTFFINKLIDWILINYRYHVAESSLPVKKEITISNSIELNDLTPGERYIFAVNTRSYLVESPSPQILEYTLSKWLSSKTKNFLSRKGSSLVPFLFLFFSKGYIFYVKYKRCKTM